MLWKRAARWLASVNLPRIIHDCLKAILCDTASEKKSAFKIPPSIEVGVVVCQSRELTSSQFALGQYGSRGDQTHPCSAHFNLFFCPESICRQSMWVLILSIGRWTNDRWQTSAPKPRMIFSSKICHFSTFYFRVTSFGEVWRGWGAFWHLHRNFTDVSSSPLSVWLFWYTNLFSQ